MQKQHAYRQIKVGVERMATTGDLPRHYHREGYANVVLAGSFVEASFAGVADVGPGDVLLHGAFDCHENRARSRQPPHLLRLPWHDNRREGLFQVRDPDLLVRLAERDPNEATACLAAALEASPPRARHWTERLAADLHRDPSLSLQRWAEANNLSPEALSRGFHRTFGVSPRLFRLEVRTRRAWNAVVDGDAALTTIAHELEFADLAHMSRSIRAFTGLAPRLWRGAARVGQVRSSVETGNLAT
jgi:AraC-like DNA-binding protein